MNGRRPPRLAKWLLESVGISERNAPLAGDLAEAFEHGKSSAWYWRQALIAIVLDWARTFRRFHRYWRAVFIGWALQVCVAAAMRNFDAPRHGYAFVLALLLWIFQLMARNWVTGDTFQWDDVRGLFLGSDTGPWVAYFVRVPLAAQVAFDEFLDYLVMYLLIVSFSSISFIGFVSAEIFWLLAHDSIRPLIRRLGFLKSPPHA